MKPCSQDGRPVGENVSAGTSAPVDLSLEAVLLLLGGVALLGAGGTLLGAASGAWSFAPEGLHALLLLVFALQTMTMGKTPFGTVLRSRVLVVLGLGVASVGIVSGVVPGLLAPLPRGLVALCFAGGGGAQLLALALDGKRRALWRAQGGPLGRLAASCAGVYALSVPVGLALGGVLSPSPVLSATLLLLLGVAVLLLAAVLEAVYRRYPEARRAVEAPQPLPFGHTMLLVTGVFMVLLGGILVPVGMGAFPFSPSVQLGLLLILFAVQTLAAGETPLGTFPRTGPVVACGLVFALLGTISCLVPGLLVVPLTLLVGGLNVAGGLLPLLRRAAPLPFPLGKRLLKTQQTLHVLSLLFGLSMFLPGILPVVVVGTLLAANGGVLLSLLHLLRRIAALAEALAPSAGRGL